MCIYPWFKGNWNWSFVHSVWMDWQSLNAAVIAFISSLIAFNISRHNAKQQRERDFIASRSFLPEALSELITYFKLSARLLKEAWHQVKDNTDQCKTPLEVNTPNLPEQYREIFSRCISLADPEVAQYLSRILILLQLHHARIVELSKNFQSDSTMLILDSNIITYLYRLAELQALVENIFNYSRGLNKFNDNNLIFSDFANAYLNLDIWLDEFDDLEGFTNRTIERSDNESSM